MKMTTPMSDIEAYIKSETEKNLKKIVTTLSYVGDEVVKGIRTGEYSNWNDQTGNLRSSIGYIIVVDGVPVTLSNFAEVSGPKEGPRDGSQTGRSFAQSLCSLYRSGIALIVVAGMEYASRVEKLENKTVLAQGEIEARKMINEMVEEINRKLAAK